MERRSQHNQQVRHQEEQPHHHHQLASILEFVIFSYIHLFIFLLVFIFYELQVLLEANGLQSVDSSQQFYGLVKSPEHHTYTADGRPPSSTSTLGQVMLLIAVIRKLHYT